MFAFRLGGLTGAINRSGAYKISETGLLVCGGKGVSGGTWLLFYRQPPPRGLSSVSLIFRSSTLPTRIASTAIYARLRLGHLWAFDFKRRPRRRKGRTSRP